MKRINISKDTNFIGSWNINDDNLCNNIVKIFEENTILHQKGGTSQGIDERVKKSIDIGIDPIDLNKKEFNDIKVYLNKLYECYQDYKTQWPYLKKSLEIVDIPTFNIQKYDRNKGHYNGWHVEKDCLDTSSRAFVFILYLNDVDKGGETEFLYQNKRISPKEGRMLLWPADWTHIHRGNPPIGKEDKYILSTWLEEVVGGYT